MRVAVFGIVASLVLASACVARAEGPYAHRSAWLGEARAGFAFGAYPSFDHDAPMMRAWAGFIQARTSLVATFVHPYRHVHSRFRVGDLLEDEIRFGARDVAPRAGSSNRGTKTWFHGRLAPGMQVVYRAAYTELAVRTGIATSMSSEQHGFGYAIPFGGVMVRHRMVSLELAGGARGYALGGLRLHATRQVTVGMSVERLAEEDGGDGATVSRVFVGF